MRTILLIADQAHVRKGMAAVLKELFAVATVHEVRTEQVTSFLGSQCEPDLIIYTPKSALIGICARFRTIKAQASKAKILLYADFTHVDRYLFEYLATGANGLLSTRSTLAEHQRAIETVMRGDSFVDNAIKGQMLSLNRVDLGEWISNSL